MSQEHMTGRLTMVKIENLTNRLVSLRLNNGKTLHLQPRMVVTEIGEAQVANNSKIQKLQERHVIALHSMMTDSEAGSTSGRGKRRTKASESGDAVATKTGE